MGYRIKFVERAVTLIREHSSTYLPQEVKTLMRQLETGSKEANSLTTDEFNTLMEIAERIDTRLKIERASKVSSRSRRKKETK